MLQLIFEAFYDSEQACKPTEADIRRTLQDKQALILLDDVQMAQHDLEHVLDVAPQSAFVVATRKRCLWARPVLFRSRACRQGARCSFWSERWSARWARRSDCRRRRSARNWVEHPLRIMQAAAVARDRADSLEDWAGGMSPAALVRQLTASIDDKQRRILLALTALPGVPLPVPHVSGIADVPDIEPSVMMLVRRGLVLGTQSRYVLADGVGDQLRRTEDPKPSVNRAITYFTAWAERYRRSPDALVVESEALLRVQQCAIDCRRWGEAFRIGRLLEGALIVGARWAAWGLRRRDASPPPGPPEIVREKPGRFTSSAPARCVSATQRGRARCWGQALKLRDAMARRARGHGGDHQAEPGFRPRAGLACPGTSRRAIRRCAVCRYVRHQVAAASSRGPPRPSRRAEERFARRTPDGAAAGHRVRGHGPVSRRQTVHPIVECRRHLFTADGAANARRNRRSATRGHE